MILCPAEFHARAGEMATDQRSKETMARRIDYLPLLVFVGSSRIGPVQPSRQSTSAAAQRRKCINHIVGIAGGNQNSHCPVVGSRRKAWLAFAALVLIDVLNDREGIVWGDVAVAGHVVPRSAKSEDRRHLAGAA